MTDSCSAAKLAIISTCVMYKADITNVHHVLALTVNNGIYTLPPAYLSCEFAFHVRFQRIVRALSLIAYETRINVFQNS